MAVHCNSKVKNKIKKIIIMLRSHWSKYFNTFFSFSFLFFFLLLSHFCLLLLFPHSSLLHSFCPTLIFFLFLHLTSFSNLANLSSPFQFSFLPPPNHSRSFLFKTSLCKLNHNQNTNSNHNLKTNQIKMIKKREKKKKKKRQQNQSI